MDVACSVYIAASLDGFIARPDGAIDWLEKPEYDTEDGLALPYETFIATVDAIVMGRKSFEKVLSFDLPTWPYDGTPVVVLSGGAVRVPDELRGKVTTDGGEPRDIVSRLAAAGHRHLYVDGGDTIQRFLCAGRITEITVTRVPVLLGRGTPLFGTLEEDVHLVHVETSAGSSGLVQSRYRVVSRA